MVCIGASALAGIHVLDETVGINGSHPLRGPLEALIPIPIVAGMALVGTWLLVTGWLGHRRTVLWPTAGTLAILAGGGYVAAAAVVSVAAHFHVVGYLLGVSATGFLAGWSLLVALRR